MLSVLLPCLTYKYLPVPCRPFVSSFTILCSTPESKYEVCKIQSCQVHEIFRKALWYGQGVIRRKGAKNRGGHNASFFPILSILGGILCAKYMVKCCEIFFWCSDADMVGINIRMIRAWYRTIKCL